MASTQRLVADITTFFPLPAPSEALHQRYVALRTASKELQRLEAEHAEVVESNASTNAACKLLTERLRFLTTLAQSIKSNTWNTSKAEYRLSVVKDRVKDEVAEMEGQLEAQKAVNDKLQTSIDIERRVLEEQKKKFSELSESNTRGQEHLANLDNRAKTLHDAYNADERVIQSMQQYYFKLMTSLFQLQREVDKLKFKTPGASELNVQPNAASNQTYHQISHILDDMSQQQRKFVAQKITLTKVLDEPNELSEIEENWIDREIQLQRNRRVALEHAIEKGDEEMKLLGREFLDEVEMTEVLLEEYADIESKNMAIDLRNARLSVLGQAMKFEPDSTMYQRFRDGMDASDNQNSEAFKILYNRKKESAEKAAVESDAAGVKLKQMKTKIRNSLSHNKATEIFECNNQKMNEFNTNVMEKLDFRSAKELLRNIMLKQHGSLSKGNDLPLPDDIMAGRLMEATHKYGNMRNHMFEEHLKYVQSVLTNDNNKIINRNIELEKEIAAIERAIETTDAETEKETELCNRFKERIVKGEAILKAKAAEKKAEETKRDDQYEAEMKKLQSDVDEAKILRDNLNAEKLELENSIRQAQIDENNLRHRYNVFAALKKESQNEKKTEENMNKWIEQEKVEIEKMQLEVDDLKKLLESAEKQNMEMESAVKNMAVKKTSLVLHKMVQEEKKELESEVIHLEKLIFKVHL